MELWGITDSGKVRQYNQDVFRIFSDDDKNVAVIVVCDGMGGANAGNIASEVAAEEFMRYICTCLDDIKDQTDIAEIMKNAVLSANRIVFEKSLYNDDLAGMGTTMTAAVSTRHGEVAANIGDSRLYHITRDAITQITKDHSVIEEMIDRGEITRSEARRHPSKNLITRAVGTSIYEPPDIFLLNLNSGDFMLLCSDGLSNVILDSEILKEFRKNRTVQETCKALVDIALSRGAPDNVTAVIFMKQEVR